MLKRWLVNVGLAELLGVAWVLGASVLQVVGSPSPQSVVFGAVYGLFEWAFFGVVPILLYLLIGEVIWPRVARRRLVSIVMGAVIVAAYPFALQADRIHPPAEAIVWLLAFAGVGATFGAVARLPGPARSTAVLP